MNAPTKALEGQVYTPSRMLDPDRFRYLCELAQWIVDSSLVPDSLCKTGPKNNKTDLPEKKVLANVFAVVEQADRWDISPFSLVQAASIVHGKLCFEGKVIAGVLAARLNIRLTYTYAGSGETMKVIVSGKRQGDEEPVTVEGTVAQWKTTGEGSPWGNPLNWPRQLAYRGSREWTRIWEPAIMLGVFSDDEMMVLAYEAAAQAATPVQSLGERLRASEAAGAGGEGFNATGAQQALEDKRQVPMETIKPRERETVPARETAAEQPKAARTVGPKAEATTVPDKTADKATSGELPLAEPTKTSEPSKGETEPEPAKDPAPLPINLAEYAEILSKVPEGESLKSAAGAYWAVHGRWPPPPQFFEKAQKIYDTYSKLAEKKIEAKEANETLRELVS